jgi:protein maelstrom
LQISSVNSFDYHTATLIGLLPAQAINVYLGSKLRSIHDVINDNHTAIAGYGMFIFEVIESLFRAFLFSFLHSI